MPLTRGLAARLGLVDRPDRRRKLHKRPVPLAGGLTVLLSAGLVTVAQAAVPGDFGERFVADLAQGSKLLGLLAGAVGICAVGLLDDAVGLRGRYKLMGQVAVLAVVMSSGLVVDTVQILHEDKGLGFLAFPLTACWLLAAINSFNLLDGMDGLLGTVAVVSFLTIAGLACVDGQDVPRDLALVLAGSVLGFLVFNLPPAKVFLGDAGSMLLGLLVGVLTLWASVPPGGATAPHLRVRVGPLLAILALPICDTLAAVVRRKLTGRSIYSTDRGHLHHHLLHRGLSPWGVLLVAGALSALAGAVAVAGLLPGGELLTLLALPAVAGTLLGTRLFGHAELVLLRERVRGLAAGLLGRARGESREVQVRLQGSARWEFLWEDLVLCAEELGLRAVTLDVNAPALHEGYYARWESPGGKAEEGAAWRAEVPLLASDMTLGRVEVCGRQGGKGFGHQIAWVARLVEEFEMPVLAIPQGGPGAGPVGVVRERTRRAEKACAG